MEKHKAEGAALQILFGGKFIYASYEWQQREDQTGYYIMQADIKPHPAVTGFLAAYYPLKQNTQQMLDAVINLMPYFDLEFSDLDMKLQALDEKANVVESYAIPSQMQEIYEFLGDETVRKYDAYRIEMNAPNEVYQQKIAPYYPSKDKKRHEKPQRLTHEETFEDIASRLREPHIVLPPASLEQNEVEKTILASMMNEENWKTADEITQSQSERVYDFLDGSQKDSLFFELAMPETFNLTDAYIGVIRMQQALSGLHLEGYFARDGYFTLTNSKKQINLSLMDMRLNKQEIESVIKLATGATKVRLKFRIKKSSFESVMRPLMQSIQLNVELGNNENYLDKVVECNKQHIPEIAEQPQVAEQPPSKKKAPSKEFGVVSSMWYDSDDEEEFETTLPASRGISLDFRGKEGSRQRHSAWFFDQRGADAKQLKEEQEKSRMEQEQAERRSQAKERKLQRQNNSSKTSASAKEKANQAAVNNTIKLLNQKSKTGLVLLKNVMKDPDKKEMFQLKAAEELESDAISWMRLEQDETVGLLLKELSPELLQHNSSSMQFN